jgi:hypothetical protein
MRSLIALLSVLLIFAGIAAVLVTDIDSESDKTKKEITEQSASVKNDIFAKRQSMKEIDSITSSMNYSFTIDNAVITAHPDSTKSI